MKKRFSKVVLAALFLCVLTLVVMVTPLAKAQIGSVSLSPSSGAAGSSVTVTVSGFKPGVVLGISLQGVPYPYYSSGTPGEIVLTGVEFVTNSAGSGSETYTVPSVPAGNYSIVADDPYNYGYSASATFTVTASTSATPTPAPSATSTSSATSTPKIPEFSKAALTLIVAAMAATTLCAVAYAKKKRRI